MTLYPRALEPAEIAQYRWAEEHLEPMPHMEPVTEPEQPECSLWSPVVILLGFLAFWTIVGYALAWLGVKW